MENSNIIAFDDCVGQQPLSKNAWNGGRTIHSQGYAMRWSPHHPRQGNGYVLEHILIVEQALGHFLRATAVVHHVDEDRRNNTNGNLVACNDRGYHMLLHARQRALDACGDASAARCTFCKSYDRQEDMYVFYRRGRSRPMAHHRACRREATKGRTHHNGE